MWAQCHLDDTEPSFFIFCSVLSKRHWNHYLLFFDQASAHLSAQARRNSHCPYRIAALLPNLWLCRCSTRKVMTTAARSATALAARVPPSRREPLATRAHRRSPRGGPRPTSRAKKGRPPRHEAKMGCVATFADKVAEPCVTTHRKSNDRTIIATGAARRA